MIPRRTKSPVALAAATALIAAAAPTFAQTFGTATYSFAFGAPGGPSTIQLLPGQSTTVFVNVSFDPGIGAIIGGGPVLGLKAGSFSISGVGAGAWSNMQLDAPYNFPLGTSAGVANGPSVSGVIWDMFKPGIGPGHASPFNPDTVWTATFTMGALSTTTLTFTDMGLTGVFYRVLPLVAPYASAGTQAVITIPCPPASLALAFAGLIAARRTGALTFAHR